MRVAVIGGNLLGCATVANVALVQEIDVRAGRSDASHTVTLFAAEPALGGADFRSVDADGARVEVGRYRTLPLLPGSFLHDLVLLARGRAGHFMLGPRRVRVPGDPRVKRGDPRALAVARPWAQGSRARAVRSFAAWDWRVDAFHLVHRGSGALDALHRALRGELWRAAAVAALVWAARRCLAQRGPLARGRGLALVVALFAVALYSPGGVVALWQRQYAFWASTAALLWMYGFTPAIARGSVLGLVRELGDANRRNRATCAPSLGALLARTALAPYVRTSASDYVTKFRYDARFAQRFLAPPLAEDYPDAPFDGANALAVHLAQLGADFANADIADRRVVLEPGNAALCDALVEAARPTTPVDVRLGTPVAQVQFDPDAEVYTVTPAGGGAPAQFDAVFLCECPDTAGFEVEAAHDEPLAQLLRYERAADAAPRGPASHLAVVVGRARASFFRFAREEQIPDRVQVDGAPGFTSFERVRGVEGGRDGVYVVVCAEDFQKGGTVGEMFEEGARVVHFERRPDTPYSIKAMGADGGAIDDSAPPLVLGTRFIYPAGSYRVAVHPEMDAISALNGASLLSKVVNWAAPAEEGEDGEEEGEEGEGGDGEEEEGEDGAAAGDGTGAGDTDLTEDKDN